MPDELPMADVAAERSDAACNRRRILEAATLLFSEHGAGGVTMQDVARAASVGVGTVYRRFGDRGGLALALLDERERGFQDAVLRGTPPLGPGAPPAERLVAFGVGYAEFVEEHVELLAALGPPGPVLGGPWAFHRAHLTLLLREAAPAIDVEYAAETLLTALAAPLHRHLRQQRDWPLERLQAGWAALAHAWLAAGRVS